LKEKIISLILTYETLYLVVYPYFRDKYV